MTIFAVWAVFSPGETSLRVEVQTESGLYVFPLDQDRIFEAPGPLGKTMVHIETHEAFVQDSPCTNKICLAMGKISHPGQWVACLPNRIFIRIAGRAPEGTEVDAHGY